MGVTPMPEAKQAVEPCENPIINRLEYPMAHVEVELVNGDFQPTGHTEILDAPWKETESFWCVNCDTELASKEEAIEHLKQANA